MQLPEALSTVGEHCAITAFGGEPNSLSVHCTSFVFVFVFLVLVGLFLVWFGLGWVFFFG